MTRKGTHRVPSMWNVIFTGVGILGTLIVYKIKSAMTRPNMPDDAM